MRIGNIVSKNSLKVSEEFNVVTSLDECIQGLPTLIVGWDYVQKHYPDYDIIDRVLGPDLRWTFSPRERRDIHAEDYNNFVDVCYENLISEVTYLFVDTITFSPKKLRKITLKLFQSKEIVTFYHSNMLYVYADKIIFGIDLKLVTYMGGKADKILRKIKERSVAFLTGEEILIGYKKYTDNILNGLKYIPYLYTQLNEKDNTHSIVHLP